ncbi:MAG: ArsA family ATPase, partial [Chloroflexota bacterium]
MTSSRIADAGAGRIADAGAGRIADVGAGGYRSAGDSESEGLPVAGRRFIFFGGKGGVGKSTCAAATALRLAERGQGPVLALSLDPAHSLADIYSQTVGPAERELAPGLFAQELDARAELAAFLAAGRQQIALVADRGTYLDSRDIDAFLDLSLPGLDEIAGLLVLARLAEGDRFRHVVVDLAPTGHALRLFGLTRSFRQVVELLRTMQEKHRFTVLALAGQYREDDADHFLASLQAVQARARAAIFEADQAAFVLVARSEPVILAETARYAARLGEMGAPLAGLILNALAPGDSR